MNQGLLKKDNKKVHKCDAIVVACIDFRFQKFIRAWTDKNLINETFDLVGFAGSTYDIGIILGQIDISVKLHNINKVVLIHHEECGAYGAQSTPERHTRDLLKAKSIILEKYPTLLVYLYYLNLAGEFISVVR